MIDHRKTLLLLRKNKSVKSTLMVKKLNYTIFMEMKEFYEKEMKENLYHPKKEILMKIGDWEACESVTSTKLRNLFIS